jgi:hypothetical protein
MEYVSTSVFEVATTVTTDKPARTDAIRASDRMRHIMLP